MDDYEILDAANGGSPASHATSPSDVEVIEDDEDGGDEPPSKKSRVAKRDTMSVAARTQPSSQSKRTRTSVTTGMEVLERISSSLDPSLQAARVSDRAAASFQNVQLLTLTQELRDLRSEVSNLRTQLSDAQRFRYDAERRADRAEQQAQLTHMMYDAGDYHRHARRGRSSFRSLGRSLHPEMRTPSVHQHRRSRTRSTPRRRYEIAYRDGTHRSYWGYPEDAPVVDVDSPPLFYRETTDTPSRGPDHYHGTNSRRPRTPSDAAPPPPSQPRFLHRSSTMSAGAGPSSGVFGGINVSITPRRGRAQADVSIDVGPGPSGTSPGNVFVQPRSGSEGSHRAYHARTPSEWAPSV